MALTTAVVAQGSAGSTPGSPFQVSIQIDAARQIGPLRPIWRFFGADEPNYATMKDGQTLIRELGEMRPGSVYFRAHNLLSSGDGTPSLKWGSTGAYAEDREGRPVFQWSILDHIFDTYLQRGVRPYVEIGFMPKDLSVRPEPYQHHWSPAAKYEEIFTGWAYPPQDYSKWSDLVAAWTRHCVEKYGRAEVERWYWEVWNEANIGYWQGTPQEFYKLHDYAIAGVRRALPTARVGGPDVAGSGGQFMSGFLDHCLRGTNYATGEIGTPIDFVSFHAKGAPRFVDDHVRMGLANQLRTIREGFRLIKSFPQLAGKPIVIGESDPDGCAACQGPQLGYRNTTMYSSYTAASFAREHDLADENGVNLEGALTWAFEFEDQPYFAGFRVLASNGIDLPVLNVFRMFSKMSGTRISAESSAAVPIEELLREGVRTRPDVAALAAIEGGKVSILVWHYHDDDLPGPDANVDLDLGGLPVSSRRLELSHYRIDTDHSNAFTVWKQMGSPEKPTPAQHAALRRAGQLTQLVKPAKIPVDQGKVHVQFTLPRQGVSLLVFTVSR